MRRLGRASPFLVALGLGVLMVVWSQTTPPRGYPDESDHYLRAYAVGHGDFFGRPNPQLREPQFQTAPPKECCELDTASIDYWVASGTRVVDVPARFQRDRFPCPPGRGVPDEPCGAVATSPPGDLEPSDTVTTMGTIEPALYVAPGLVMRTASTALDALRLGRLTNAVLGAGLMLIGALALAGRAGSALALTGLIVATTPSIVFHVGSISPSAIEIVSGIAFFAVLLRISRTAPVMPWLWAGAALTGVALAVSRSLGPVWIVFDVVIVTFLAGPRRVLDLIRESVVPAALAATAVITAGLTTVAWEITRQPGIPFDFDFFLGRLGPAIEDYGRIGTELIAKFGSIDLGMPWPTYYLWAALLLAIVGIAFVVGSNRERLVLGGLIVACLALPAVLPAATLNQNGFGLQGRHVLAAVVSVPMLAGEIAYRNRAALPTFLLTVCAGAVHVGGVVIGGRDYGWTSSGGTGGAFPKGGWMPWMIAAVVGGAMIGLSGVLGRNPSTVEERAGGDDGTLAEHR